MITISSLTLQKIPQRPLTVFSTIHNQNIKMKTSLLSIAVIAGAALAQPTLLQGRSQEEVCGKDPLYNTPKCCNRGADGADLDCCNGEMNPFSLIPWGHLAVYLSQPCAFRETLVNQ